MSTERQRYSKLAVEIETRARLFVEREIRQQRGKIVLPAFIGHGEYMFWARKRSTQTVFILSIFAHGERIFEDFDGNPEILDKRVCKDELLPYLRAALVLDDLSQITG